MIGPLRYAGGKLRLAPRIVGLLPTHTTYVEPFAGGAQVFFHKPPSRVEVLNDLNGDLVNFFRVCQIHHDELIRFLRFTVHSRALHKLFGRQDPATLTDVQRAARFLYLQKTSYGGKVVGQTYGYGVTGRPFNPAQLPKLIEAAAARLVNVQLESSAYERVLDRYDRPTTIFYCDPPYVGLRLYPHNFVDADFGLLADRLRRLTGKFLLSINDHPVARAAFVGFHCQRLPVAYSAPVRGSHGHELIIANFPLPGRS